MIRRSWWVLAASIAVLALAATANSIPNQFTYDDVFVIVKNPRRMHSLDGWWREFSRTYWPGGDGYRPLTILMFRLEWVIGGGSSAAFHGLNVALHTATAVVVFWLACGVLPLAAAWVAAMLFAVHPVHVEAIASVVGQSELWVALLVSLAVGCYIHGRAAGRLTWKRWFALGALYALACLFKEHAIVLPALLLLAEITIVRDRVPLRQRLTEMRLPMLALAVIALGYLWARSRVLVGGLSGFQPHVVFQTLNLSATDRVLTMIGVVPEWLRLFLWPARLMTEYTPPYVDIAQGPGLMQLPGFLLLLAVLGLLAACWRRSPVTSFGIGWLMIALLPASNFLVPAGFIIAERTLYLPSVGAILAVASALPWLYARFENRPLPQAVAAFGLLSVIGLGAVRTYSGNTVWKDNDSLFRQQVKQSPQSYRSHFLLGQLLFEKKRLTEGESHYRQALRLFPYDPTVAFGLAEQYRNAGMCKPAITMYQWLYEMKPASPFGRTGFAYCLLVTLQPDQAIEEALTAIRVGGNVSEARKIIAVARQARDSLEARRLKSQHAPAGQPLIAPMRSGPGQRGDLPRNRGSTLE